DLDRVQPGRQRQLDQDAVDAVVGVEVGHRGQHVLPGGVGGGPERARPPPPPPPSRSTSPPSSARIAAAAARPSSTLAAIGILPRTVPAPPGPGYPPLAMAARFTPRSTGGAPRRSPGPPR